jgi:hypothetical protein
VQYVNPSPSSGSQTITGTTTITASYTTQLYVNAYVNSGSDSGSNTVSGSGWYNEGALVTVTAYPTTGWYFSSWTGVSGGNPYQFNIYSPTSIGANFDEYGDLYYSALDYGTYANAYSTATFTGPETTSITWSGGADGGYVIPGTYSVSYGNSQYGAGVYSAPSSATVSPGGDTYVFATYYTPTALSASFSVGVNTDTIYGYLTTADTGAGLGGQAIYVSVSTTNGEYWYGPFPTSTNSNGFYSYTTLDHVGDFGVTNMYAHFGGNGGYLSSTSPWV